MRRLTKTVKGDLLNNFMFLTAIMVVFLGFIFSIYFYKSSLDRAYSAVQYNNRSLNYIIEGFVYDIITLVEYSAKNGKIVNASKDRDACKAALHIFKSISEANTQIAYIYSAYDDGLLVINDYEAPKNFDPRTRPWYKSAIKAAPHASVGNPYQEAKDKEWLISINKALIDQSGQQVGVVSIDTSIDFIARLLEERSTIPYSSHSYIVKKSGEIIIHHNSRYLGKKISTVVGHSLRFAKVDESFSYEREGSIFYACYSKIEGTDWIVMTIVDKKEILTPVIGKLVVIIAFTAFLSIAIGLALSRLLAERFAKPMNQLQRELDAISNWHFDASDYEYPDNEIGIIAQQAQSLFDGITNKMSDAIIICNARGLVSKCNDAAVAILGFLPQGLKLDTFVPGYELENRPVHGDGFQSENWETTYAINARRQKVYINMYSNQLYDSSQGFSGWLCIFRLNNRLKDSMQKYRLTYREVEIISHLNEGLCYKQIARALDISQNTVRNHVQNIYYKTKVKKNSALLRLVI